MLSVVVPVFNLAEDAEHLERELSKLDRTDVQVIIVNDGSTDGTAEVLESLKTAWDDIVIIESPENKGAGVARNLGFPHSIGKYTLFFDSDDFLHPDAIVNTIRALEESGADASINSYEFIRNGGDVSTGMNVIDRDIWRRYAGRFLGRTFTILECPEFLEFTNFPWNKLIRTSHFQSLALAPFFGETRVNNDIQGHWNILLNARSLIVDDQQIVTHRISEDREHLSRSFGKERLELFAALAFLHETLKRRPGGLEQYASIYWRFSRRLIDWAAARMGGQFQIEFHRLKKDLVQRASILEVCGVVEAHECATYRWLLDAMD